MSMEITDWSEVLFVGWGDDGGVSHYRSKTPARELGAEWVTFLMSGEPYNGDGSRVDHKVIVVQSCWERWQLALVKRMRASGAIVLANVDDWLPAVSKLGAAHSYSGHFVGKRERTFVEFLQLCDGALTSTQWIADRLRRVAVFEGMPVRVARNGLDMRRYDVWRNQSTRSTDQVIADEIVVGWAGGTGHLDALSSVVPALWEVMATDPRVVVTTAGERLPDAWVPSGLRKRVRHAHWADMEFYPRTIDGFDIVLAPAMTNDFYRGKSQLRFYEAAAMGKPVIASPMYDEIDVNRTGMIAQEHSEWVALMLTLAHSADLRELMGANARRYVEQHATIQARADEWRDAIVSCIKDRDAPTKLVMRR